MSNDVSIWILIAVLVALLIWNLTRRRKSSNSNLDAALGVISNIESNQKVVEARAADYQSKKKFQTGMWRIYKDKLTFLPADLVTNLTQAFAMAEDFNSRIDNARKSNSMATLQDMPLDKFRVLLSQCREGIVTWLKTGYQNDQQNSARRGCLGF
jgi:hypothetical protein